MSKPRKGLLLIMALSFCFIIGSFCYADYPLLDTITYSADPSCLEYNGRIYSYWSNDDNNNGSYTMHEITCLSTNDLKNWTNHGQVFRVPQNCSWASNSWAPSVVYRNGYFWMYFGNGGSSIGVAKSSSPTGPFTDAKGSALITPAMPNCNVQWCFDPGVFVDDDGRVYMFFGGGGPGNCRGIELGSDMISTVGTAVTIDAPRFFEASWLHKYNGKYYLSYSSDFSQGAATIEYMMSSSPLSGYVHKGTVLPNPPSNSGNNNHHSIFQYRGNWYIGYHNRYTATQQGIDTTYKRNACLDQLYYNADGTMQLVTCTQNGLPLLPTPPSGPTATPTPTPTATPKSAFTQIEAESYNTQSGVQTETCGEGGQDVAFIENGDYVVYNNINFGSGATSFQARVASANSGGNIEIRLDSATGTLVGTCPVTGTGGWQTYTTSSCSVSGASGTHNLYLKFTGGSGYLFNLNWFQFYSGSAPTPTPTATPTSGNLIPNPGMETGNTNGWAINGAGTIAASTAQKHSGSYSLLHTGRTATWNGPLQNLTSKVQSGRTYACSGWVRLNSTASASIIMTIKKVDGNGTTYTNVASGTGSNSLWVQLSGNYTLSVSGTLTELSIYFEGPASGVSYYLDDVSVQ